MMESELRIDQGAGLLRKNHVKIPINQHGFSNMASDWREATLPANLKLGLKILVN